MLEQKEGVSQEELQEDAELAQEVASKEDDIKAKIVTKYGLDATVDADLITKLAQDRIEDQKRFGKLQGQKIHWRERATKPKVEPTVPVAGSALDVLKQAEERVKTQFMERDLEEAGLPDDLKAEVQKVVTLQGISVKKALQDPYIVFKKTEYDTKKKTEEAAISRKNNQAGNYTFEGGKPPDVDGSTPEGRAQIAAWRKSLEK